MNKTFKKSRQMKDSGIEWIGEIPKDWEAANIKTVFQSVTQKNNPIISNNILSLMKDIGIIPYSEKGDVGNKCSDDISRYTVVEPDDIVMNSMNVIIGSVGKSNYQGVLSPVYHVLRIRDKNANFVNYYDNLFKTRSFQQSLKGFGNGILEHRMRIPIGNLNKVKLPLPPLHEQQAIATYLDEQVGKMDRLISEQKQAIEQWKAYKQSLITETVTKGLNPDVEMKDSGIEWIGEIPKDWKVSRIKYEFVCLDHKRKPISAENRSVENNVFDYYGASGVIDKVNDFIFDETLLLISEDGANLVMRNLPLVYIASGKYWVNNHAHVLKPNSYNDLKYMFYLLEAGDYNPYITGSAQPKLSQNKLLSYKIVVPPLQEQQAISDYLDGKCLKIDQTIEQKQQLIKQLEEYKQSLIYECVTGKRRVL